MDGPFKKLNRVGIIQGFFQGMIGSEDLALAKHSILIITSGDLGTVFSQVTQVKITKIIIGTKN